MNQLAKTFGLDALSNRQTRAADSADSNLGYVNAFRWLQ